MSEYIIKIQENNERFLSIKMFRQIEKNGNWKFVGIFIPVMINSELSSLEN